MFVVFCHFPKCVLVHNIIKGEVGAIRHPVNYFTDRSKAVPFVDHLCYVCLVLFMLSRLFIAALWSNAGKWLSSWLLFVMFNCVFVTFPCGILGQVWYLIGSIPDLYRLSYFLTMSLLYV